MGIHQQVTHTDICINICMYLLLFIRLTNKIVILQIKQNHWLVWPGPVRNPPLSKPSFVLCIWKCGMCVCVWRDYTYCGTEWTPFLLAWKEITVELLQWKWNKKRKTKINYTQCATLRAFFSRVLVQQNRTRTYDGSSQPLASNNNYGGGTTLNLILTMLCYRLAWHIPISKGVDLGNGPNVHCEELKTRRSVSRFVSMIHTLRTEQKPGSTRSCHRVCESGEGSANVFPRILIVADAWWFYVLGVGRVVPHGQRPGDA